MEAYVVFGDIPLKPASIQEEPAIFLLKHWLLLGYQRADEYASLDV